MPRPPATTARLEAFSDGVIAVIITIMVLELKVPHQDGLAGLRAILPTLFVYALSFAFTGIYWLNHRHLLARTEHTDDRAIHANLLFLFCLSLLLFFTGYLLDKHLDSFAVALYAVSNIASGASFMLLRLAIDRHLRLAGALAREDEQAQHKHWLSLAVYLIAIPLAFYHPPPRPRPHRLRHPHLDHPQPRRPPHHLAWLLQDGSGEVPRRMRDVFKCIYLLSMSLASVCAQVANGPIAAPSPSPLPVPLDHMFPGTIHLNLDATDTAHGLVRIKEAIPVHSHGETVLFYPEWETTSHSPTASAVELAGLHIEADGQEQSWWRDPHDVHAFHVFTPSGARTLTVQFEYLPRAISEISPGMIDLQWQRMLLYPAGWYARDISVAPTLRLPSDLHAFSALTVANDEPASGSLARVLTFAPVTLDNLVDAPVYAGHYVQQVNLGIAGKSPVHLDLLAKADDDLAIRPETLAQLRALITQTELVFGPPPFSHYEAIVSLDDDLSPGGGLEHLEEGENNMPAHFLTDYAHQLSNRDLIAHEYVHAWNGRYRQPADLWSPTFNQPTNPSLLWVYEGQTEFWGRVLAARSGMRSDQETLDKLALDAALVANRPGRQWKNLADSTLDALYMPGHPPAWRDWQRREDYYPEGVLLWLDVEARLRERSNGKSGLDQFAARFFAAHGHSQATSTYTFNDVCRTLNALAPDDWRGLLDRHLLTHLTDDAMAGLARAGWRLTYSSTPTESFRQEQEEAHVTDLSNSIGLQVRDNGQIRSVVWDGPAFQAGLASGARITKVDGQPFTPATLLAAVEASTRVPIQLSVSTGNSESQRIIAYTGPLRYPQLERIPGSKDYLTPLLRAR